MIKLTDIEWLRDLAKIMPDRLIDDKVPIWPLVIYCICAIFCLGSSASFHWFYPKNSVIFEILHRLDLGAISFLIFGSVTPIIYYVFYCNKIICFVWILLQFISCASTFIVSMCSWFHEESYIKFRGAVYAACGLFAGLVAFHCQIQSRKAG